MAAREAALTRSVGPLSYGQRSLWFLHQMAPDNAAYNVVAGGRIRRKLDPQRLSLVVQRLAERHPALRTAFDVDQGQPVQVVRDAGDVRLECFDANGWDDLELLRQATAQAVRPFDLRRGPLFRFALFSRGVDDNVILLVAHHIVFDGWSLALVVRELRRLYRVESAGLPVELPEISAAYSDYVEWQQALLVGEGGIQHRDYWKHQLRGSPPSLQLPTDYPRSTRQTFSGATIRLRLADDLRQSLKGLARQEHVTPYTLLLSAFLVLLYRYTGQEDVLVGSATAGRSDARFNRTVGYFASPVVLRADLSGEPAFRKFLAQMGTTVRDALRHLDYPLARLVEDLQPSREPGRSPLFDVMFNLLKFETLARGGQASEASDPLSMERYEIAQPGAQFDLTLDVTESATATTLELRYRTELFQSGTIARMLGHLVTLLQGIVADPEQPVSALPLLTAAERQQLLVDWNATSEPLAGQACIHQLVEAQVDRTPSAIAIRAGGQQLSYAELDARANQLAHYLHAQGVRRGDLVGLSVERTVEMVVALLGVTKLGAAYTPVDPAYPEERRAMMIEDSGARVMLIHSASGGHWVPSEVRVIELDSAFERQRIRSQPTTRPQHRVTPDDLAYVIYTSGSTGAPRGVAVAHRAVVNLLHAVRRTPGISQEDVVLAITTLSFDIAVYDLWAPLTVGAQIVLAPAQAGADPRLLLDLLARSHASVLQGTPSTWRLLVEAGWDGPLDLKVISTGEALPGDLAHLLTQRSGEVWNMYGPTETTVWSTGWRVPAGASGGPVMIGQPLANTQVYVLDRHQELLPIGVVGELYIAGDGVAQGYFLCSGLTDERFIPDPFAGTGRMYRTGDLVRWREDGLLECFGRNDDQVKLRGVRVELGEIEQLLKKHPGVRDAVVVARADDADNVRLVAYITIIGLVAPGADELRAHLRLALPEVMLPASFVVLTAFPFMPNGKLDRKCLPAPLSERPQLGIEYLPPMTPIEHTITTIWEELLGVSGIGLRDNFFDLGGHSLLATRLIGRLQGAFGIELPLHTLFELQTIGQLAERIAMIQWAAESAAVGAPVARGGRQEIAL